MVVGVGNVEPQLTRDLVIKTAHRIVVNHRGRYHPTQLVSDRIGKRDRGLGRRRLDLLQLSADDRVDRAWETALSSQGQKIHRMGSAIGSNVGEITVLRRWRERESLILSRLR